jgi:peptidoglycan/xylan/chitin deacetylase (PgdA/CDA1 family)
MIAALEGSVTLPTNAVTVTVDDGYKTFLEYGYPIFRKHNIPTTVYAVSGFVDGRLWLWFDQIEFGLRHTDKTSLRANVGGKEFDLQLGSAQERAAAYEILMGTLKQIPNRSRVDFVCGFGDLCGVEIPPIPPAHCTAMNWDDLRAIVAKGVEIGCHSETHPILSRISDERELSYEICGSKELMEQSLGQPINHFCYPNGHEVDVSEAAARIVRAAGFSSAVTSIPGMNTYSSDPMQLRRVPFDSDLDYRYAIELLAGLHM